VSFVVEQYALSHPLLIRSVPSKTMLSVAVAGSIFELTGAASVTVPGPEIVPSVQFNPPDTDSLPGSTTPCTDNESETETDPELEPSLAPRFKVPTPEAEVPLNINVAPSCTVTVAPCASSCPTGEDGDADTVTTDGSEYPERIHATSLDPGTESPDQFPGAFQSPGLDAIQDSLHVPPDAGCTT